MKKFIAILVFTIGLVLPGEAQSFLSELQKQKQGEGKVTVKQSADIDNLVNNAQLKHDQEQLAKQKSAAQEAKDNNAPVAAKSAPQTTEQHKPDSLKHKQTEQKPSATEQKQPEKQHTTAKQTEPTTETPSHPAVDTSKKMMRNSYKVTGYRIQAFSGGNTRADREKANRIGDEIKQKYPDQPVYVHFYSPRWICRVGNFRSYQEAAQVLKGIKAMGYTQACIVKGKITVAY